MMNALAKLMECLPRPPLYQFNWTGLSDTAFGPFIEKMAQTGQDPIWHGEGDVWAHTKLVCEALAALPAFRALPERQRQAVALAALLHDIGKITTTRMEGGRLVSPGHASAGAQTVRAVLWTEYGLSGSPEYQSFRETVFRLIRYHTLPLHLLKSEDAEQRIRKIAACGEHTPDFSVKLLCLLAEADVRGRVCDDQQELLDAVQLSRLFAEEAGCLDAPYPFASSVTKQAYFSGRNVWPEQELFDETWGEVLLMCGLPGTGKDTWIRDNCADMPMVSLDDLRRQMHIKSTDDQGTVVQAARERARVFLREKQPFVWNATSLTPSLRRKSIRLFEEYGASVRIVFLEAQWEETLRRNENRQHVVPASVVHDMLGRLVPPEPYEARYVDWICI